MCFSCLVGLNSSRIECCTSNQYQHHFPKPSPPTFLNTYSNIIDTPIAPAPIEVHTSPGHFYNPSGFNPNSGLNHGLNNPSGLGMLARRPSFTLQSPLQHRPIVENIISDHNTYRHVQTSSNLHPFQQTSADPFQISPRRSQTLRRSDSYSPGKLCFDPSET